MLFIRILLVIASLIIALYVNVELYFLGKSSSNYLEFYPALFKGIVIFLLGLALINIVVALCTLKKSIVPPAKKPELLSSQWQSDINDKYRRSLRKVRILFAFSVIISVFSLFALLFIVYLSGCLQYTSGTSFVTIIFVASLIYSFISPVKRAHLEHVVLDSKHFPELYAIAKKACKATKVYKIVQLSYTENDIAVYKKLFTVVILLNPTVTKLLSKDELYNLLIYKLYTVSCWGNVRYNFYSKIVKKWDTIFSIWGKAFNGVINSKTARAIKEYQQIYAYRNEILLNEKVSRVGDVQQFINALTKTEMYKLYRNGENRMMKYEIYSSETPAQDWYAKDMDAYLQTIKTYGKIWENLLSLQLPSEETGKLTLAMTMDYFRCRQFDSTPAVHTDEYNAELTKLTTAGNQLMKESLYGNYKAVREKHYLSLKPHFQTYRMFKEKHTVSNCQLILCAKALYTIENTKVADICRYLIDQESPWGYYMLATVYFSLNDKRCVPLFEKAMSTEILAVNCIQNICKFAINSGNRALFEQYNEHIVPTIENFRKNRVNRAWVDGITFDECTIEPPVKKQLIESLLHELGEHISEIYMASYRKNNVRTNVVMVIFKPQSDENKQKELFAEMSEIITAFARNDIVPPSTIFYNNQLNAIQQFKESLVYRSQNNRQ